MTRRGTWHTFTYHIPTQHTKPLISKLRVPAGRSRCTAVRSGLPAGGKKGGESDAAGRREKGGESTKGIRAAQLYVTAALTCHITRQRPARRPPRCRSCRTPSRAPPTRPRAPPRGRPTARPFAAGGRRTGPSRRTSCRRSWPRSWRGGRRGWPHCQPHPPHCPPRRCPRPAAETAQRQRPPRRLPVLAPGRHPRCRAADPGRSSRWGRGASGCAAAAPDPVCGGRRLSYRSLRRLSPSCRRPRCRAGRRAPRRRTCR
mmetsp:Transcript_5130/g.17095  ORF Transcript_5130/g.17095 Transcript_5130/m.17095 type:complete len:258 (-) Transcript_5130:95-868(-)